MKKLSIILTTLFLTNAYAVDDSIAVITNQANKYLVIPEDNLVAHSTIIRDIRPGQKTSVVNYLLSHLNTEAEQLVSQNPFYLNRIESEKYEGDDVTLISQLQEYFSLNPTGIVDPQTYNILIKKSPVWEKAVLEQSLQELIKVKEKQSQKQTSKYIVVNIPNMTAYAYNYDTTTQISTIFATSKIVVGKPTTKTPFQDFSIWGLKYNPDWRPTSNMIKRSVIKGDGFNTAWLKSHAIIVTDQNGQKVNYTEMKSGEKYSYRQPSGDGNALGLLKFETDSQENIYLHDTNERKLFDHNMRLYSSGCVRVQNYLDFAVFVSDTSTQEIEAKIENNKMKIEKITEPVPVYFSYALAMPIEQEIPAFYLDVYKKTKFYQ